MPDSLQSLKGNGGHGNVRSAIWHFGGIPILRLEATDVADGDQHIPEWRTTSAFDMFDLVLVGTGLLVTTHLRD